MTRLFVVLGALLALQSAAVVQAAPKGRVDVIECRKVLGIDSGVSVLIQLDLDKKQEIATVTQNIGTGPKIFGTYVVRSRTTACGPRCLGGPTVYVGNGFELTVSMNSPHDQSGGIKGQLMAEQPRGARINEAVSCRKTR